MFGIFKSKPLLSAEDMDFQIATYKWLLKHFGGSHFYSDTHLILPTKEFFPSKVASEHEAAIETFNTVKRYAGMGEWPCSLSRQEEDLDSRVAPAIALANVPKGPLGTFEVQSQSDIVITYNPSIVANPTQLVATFAHELAHYLTGACSEAPPGGWENWEFATDISATFLGFGVFMANAAFNFKQFTDVDSQGWQYNRSGYLSEAEHIVALAIFLRLKSIAPQQAEPFLKQSLRKMLKTALTEIDSSSILDELSLI